MRFSTHPLARKFTIVALLVAPLVMSTPAQAAAPTGISVRGVGKASVTPDAVRVSVTLTNLAQSATDAQAAVATKAFIVRTRLAAAKVKSSDIATSRLSVQPEYSYANNQPQIIGQRATQGFTIVIRSVSGSGSIIDDLTSAAGEGLSIDAATPFVTNDDAATERARATAVKNAKSKALAYAKMLGVRLGSVQSVTESDSVGSYPLYPAMGKAEDAVSTQIDAGTQQVTVTVDIRWSIRS